MTRRREFAEAAPGVVKVRLQGDFGADVIVRILRDHPAVEVLTGPDRYEGDRQYLMVRVRMDGGLNPDRDVPEAADIAYAKLHPDPYTSWVNGEPPGGAR